MVWNGTCDAFRILNNAEQNSKLEVLSAAFHGPRNHFAEDNEHTVISAKTAYTV